MNRTMELLEALKKARGIRSDYALAAYMDITRQQVSKYRTNRESLTDEKALWIAEQLGIDEGYVLAMMNAERAERANNTSALLAWQKVVDRLKAIGPAALTMYAAGPLFSAAEWGRGVECILRKMPDAPGSGDCRMRSLYAPATV